MIDEEFEVLGSVTVVAADAIAAIVVVVDLSSLLL